MLGGVHPMDKEQELVNVQRNQHQVAREQLVTATMSTNSNPHIGLGSQALSIDQKTLIIANTSPWIHGVMPCRCGTCITTLRGVSSCILVPKEPSHGWPMV